MFSWIMDKLAGNYNEAEIQKLWPIIEKINILDKEYESLTDQDIKDKTPAFIQRIEKGESLDTILPEAFAVVKQACRRMVGQEFDVKGEKMTWDMVPYDVQLLGWIILHRWTIAEMKTGEGKTLVATLPAYLNALTKKGVHVVTVNDYLASRDAAWMGYLYERLGLTVGCVVKWVALQERKEQYGRDITYVENSELGFDYLRDNLVKTWKGRNLLHRPLNYAIIDEIDSILIDEARTPLIISEPAQEATDKYTHYARLVQSLIPSKVKKKVSKGLLHELINDDYKKGKKEEEQDTGDYYIDEKSKTAQLSSKGIDRLEKLLKVNNLYEDIGYEEIHHIENALRAKAVYERDKDYIVQNGEVLIVDEHTGRAMQGRRFSQGLHQAIEAKEWVTINRESKTIATITYQNFFKQYTKLSGMTGTAVTEWEEFAKIYELEVLEVPTNKPVIRVDQQDRVYFNQQAKRNFVTKYIQFAHTMGQPILIGTSSINTSEYVSGLLQKINIPHAILNAKQHEREADIVSAAGKWGSVVVATNMAWRGTDIKLEKWLNIKIADNYVQWMHDASEKQTVSAVVYSDTEYNLTIDAISKKYGLTEETTNASLQDWTSIGDGRSMKVRINTKKKNSTDAFAEIIMQSEADGDTIKQDLHYGLFILGTEKHDSRRIDNQLRWRAGRQGDPGFSIFFVALDDLIMRKMWGERIQSIAGMLMSKDELMTVELTQNQFTSSIQRAQKQMEGMHFGVRKQLFEYDSVINKQREKVYAQRDDILASEDDEDKKTAFVARAKEELETHIHDIIGQQVTTAQTMDQSVEDLLDVLHKEMGIKFTDDLRATFVKKEWEDIAQEIPALLIKQIMAGMKKLDDEKLFVVFKDVYLHYLDRLWVDHIDEMQYLREKVALMWYAQQDPLLIYKKESYDKFQTLMYRFKFDSIAAVARVDYARLAEQEQAQLQLTVTGKNVTKQQDFVQRLQKAAWSKEFQNMVKEQSQVDPRQKIFEDEDGVEVFEVDGDKNDIGWSVEVIDTNTDRKLRPNDIVTVRYSDGKIVADTKYKKVKDDIDDGKCVVV